MTRARHTLLFVGVALVGAWVVVRLVGAPNYPDAYYHFNAAVRLASGAGLTDTYLWTYIGAPESGTIYPSHLYWMPLTSLTAALGMTISGAPGSHAAAQLLFVPMLAGMAGMAFALGWRMGKTARHAWSAGLIALLGGYFARFWGAMDTFTPYAFAGGLCLLLSGLMMVNGRGWVAAAAGASAGLAHLTRADGVLLLVVGIFVLIVSRRRLALAAAMGIGYIAVMMPWIARNLSEIGAPLPLGGTMTIWIREYNEIFNYPAVSSPSALLTDSAALFGSRWEAFINNLGTFAAVEGLIIMTPLMLIGLLRRIRDPFWRPFWLYALGLHAAMTIVFPFPGYRGGLFHSVAALLPFWAVLGILGIDDAVEWAARRRRWRPRTAKRVFSAALVALVVYLSVNFGLAGRVPSDAGTPALYTGLRAALPDGARVLINDPAGLYYHTGMGGAALPNADPALLPEIARRYEIDYLVLESPETAPIPLLPLFDAPTEFLTPIPFEGGALIYAISLD